jgi:hypothetical protein
VKAGRPVDLDQAWAWALERDRKGAAVAAELRTQIARLMMLVDSMAASLELNVRAGGEASPPPWMR